MGRLESGASLPEARYVGLQSLNRASLTKFSEQSFNNDLVAFWVDNEVKRVGSVRSREAAD